MEELTVHELRKAERFVLKEPIPASFGAAAITIVNFSTFGLQAAHDEPLKLGAEGRLSFPLTGTTERVAVRARVVWSHFSKNPDARGKRPYYSGFRIEGQPDLETSLNRLMQMDLVRADEKSIDRKREILREKAKQRAAHSAVKTITTSQNLSADEQLMIQHARERLHTHPEEAVKWFARAKFAPIEVQSRIQLSHYKEDILAVWEYLERTIDIDKIARAFEAKK